MRGMEKVVVHHICAYNDMNKYMFYCFVDILFETYRDADNAVILKDCFYDKFPMFYFKIGKYCLFYQTHLLIFFLIYTIGYITVYLFIHLFILHKQYHAALLKIYLFNTHE